MILAYGHGSNPIVLIFGTLVVSGVLILIRTAMRQAEGKSRYSRPAISARLPKPPTRPATDGETLKMLAATTRALYLTADDPMLAGRMFRRMTSPQPGDFVLDAEDILGHARKGTDFRGQFGRIIDVDEKTCKIRTMEGSLVDRPNVAIMAIPDTLRTDVWTREADIR